MTSFEALAKRAGIKPHKYRKYEDYVDGRGSLDSLGISLPPQARILELQAPFPKLSIDVLSEVLRPEGFIHGEDETTPALLERWWQANDLDTNVRLGITEALVQGGAFWVVGPGTDDTPRITVHSRIGMAVDRDHMGRVIEGVRLYGDHENRSAVHYRAGVNDYYHFSKARGQWIFDESVNTGCSRPLVVPMTNRVRLHDLHGRSEIAEIASLTDAASRTLTNQQLAQETVAIPQRYVFGEGMEVLKSANGGAATQAAKFASYYGALWTGPEGSSAGQLPGADLTQITSSYKLYAQVVSSVTGIPPSMLGITTDNPSSAEAMRVAKERLITRAEAKASMFGDALEEVARIALELMGVNVDTPETLELRWRDPATPSDSARTAAMLQALAQGVIHEETAREVLRLTPAQMARERELSARDLTRYQQLGGGADIG